MIYYILYNKINSINSKKDLKTVNINMDKLIINNNIYNTYETNYKEYLYEIISKKINNLEEKIKIKIIIIENLIKLN